MLIEIGLCRKYLKYNLFIYVLSKVLWGRQETNIYTNTNRPEFQSTSIRLRPQHPNYTRHIVVDNCNRKEIKNYKMTKTLTKITLRYNTFGISRKIKQSKPLLSEPYSPTLIHNLISHGTRE